ARPLLLGQKLDGGGVVRAASGLPRLPARPRAEICAQRREMRGRPRPDAGRLFRTRTKRRTVMKLGYAIAYVPDVKKTVEFYERAFGLKRSHLDDKGFYGELGTGDTKLAFVAHGYQKENLPGGFRAAQNDEA